MFFGVRGSLSLDTQENIRAVMYFHVAFPLINLFGLHLSLLENAYYLKTYSEFPKADVGEWLWLSTGSTIFYWNIYENFQNWLYVLLCIKVTLSFLFFFYFVIFFKIYKIL